jgi:hypothetical protein
MAALPCQVDQLKPKRSVRFAEHELCHFSEGAIVDLIEDAAHFADIWYQHAELAHIKRKAMAVSREAHRYGFGSIITNTYGNASEETQEALNTWCRSASNRRGLERWINDEYSAKRSDIRRRTIQSVLRAQHKMKQENISDVDYGMKVLSRLSEAFSQDSRSFARALGQADSLAAQTVDDPAAVTAAGSKGGAKSHSAPLRTPSPKSVIIHRATRPRKNLGLSGETDFRNFV